MSSLPLFDNVRVQELPAEPAPMATRREKMEAAFDRADERFREEYRAFVIRYADRHALFTAEDCQMRYKELKHLPQPREWRASGGVIQRLLKDGTIEKAGHGMSKNRGVPVLQYRKGF